VASEHLKRAVAESEVLEGEARRMAQAFGRADLDRLRDALERDDAAEVAQALGWSPQALQAVVNTVELESRHLAHEFPELRALARERKE
jgi:hypothetical protein